MHLVFVIHSFLLKHSSISSRKGTECDDGHYSSLLDYGSSMQLVLIMHYFFLKHSLCILPERYRMWWRPLLFFPWLWLFYTASLQYAFFLLITLSVSSWKGTGCDDDHYSTLFGYGYSIHLVFVMHSFLQKHSSISSRKGTGRDDDHYSSLLDYGYSMQLVLVMHYFFLKHSLCILAERYMISRPLFSIISHY